MLEDKPKFEENDSLDKKTNFITGTPIGIFGWIPVILIVGVIIYAIFFN